MVLRIFPGTTSLCWFVVPFFIFACSGIRESTQLISVEWKNDKAVALLVPRHLLSDVPEDSIAQLLTVHLAGSLDQPAIIGNYELNRKHARFEPLIPLTRNFSYNIRLRNAVIGNVSVRSDDPTTRPEVAAVYPSQDTLPANLLKFYLHFSQPMREDQSLRHLSLLNEKGDTVPGVFLELKPELWNREGTLLTVWLDPGRIKRDLQPNRKLGEPLEPGARYSLVINAGWPDKEGNALGKNFTKRFVVVARDPTSPDIRQWKIESPEAGTKDTLIVRFDEHLDRVLSLEAISIRSVADSSVMTGVAELKEEESIFAFVPDKPWPKGSLALEVEARLEDLCGNNLNRVFDRDITATQQAANVPKHTREFATR